MKKFTLLLIFTIISFNLKAQQLLRNLIIISTSNQNFIVQLDNNQVNPHPMNQVIITGLDKNYYHVSAILNHQKIEANIYVPPLSEITYQINNGYGNNFSIVNLVSLQNQNYSNQQDIFPYGNIQNVGINGQINININTNNNVNATQTVVTPPPAPEVIYVKGYEGEIGCQPPVSSSRFKSMLSSIDNQDFDNAKKRVAKQIIDSNCMTTDNIVVILELFDFDKDKLEIAKYAYDYVYDIENYYLVNNVFDFDSYVKELDDYIRSK